MAKIGPKEQQHRELREARALRLAMPRATVRKIAGKPVNAFKASVAKPRKFKSPKE